MENGTMRPLEEVAQPQGEKVIIFHGFSREELMSLINLLNSTPQLPKDIIMATTTETSLNWKVKELIEELAKEHEYFKAQEKRDPNS